MIKKSLMLVGLLILLNCKAKMNEPYEWKTIKVRATAYNSLAYQTSTQPNIAAWGDSLLPGMKCIAVSRDLIKKGLKHNTEVILEGYPGVFLVKDKMHYRWKNRIDIYMGVNVRKARKWGIKQIKIFYKVPKDTIIPVKLPKT